MLIVLGAVPGVLVQAKRWSAVIQEEVGDEVEEEEEEQIEGW